MIIKRYIVLLLGIWMSLILSCSVFKKKTPERYMKMAQKCIDKKDYSKARKNYSRAIYLDGSYFLAYRERALVEIKMDSLERAIDDLGVYIESIRMKESMEDKKLLEKALLQRAQIMLKCGYKSDACSDWTDACELNISNAPCEEYRLNCK